MEPAGRPDRHPAALGAGDPGAAGHGAGAGGVHAARAADAAVLTRGVLAGGVCLGHPRHRGRRFLPACPEPPPAGRLCGRALHLLPAGHGLHPGRAGGAGGLAAATPWQCGHGLGDGLWRPGRGDALAGRSACLGPAEAATFATRPAGPGAEGFRRGLCRLFPTAGPGPRARLPAVLPVCRGPAPEDGAALSVGLARGRWPGPVDPGGGGGLWHGGGGRPDPGGAAGGLADCPSRPRTLPVADGAEPECAQRGVCAAGPVAAPGRAACSGQRRHCPRAVWLRPGVCRLHGLPAEAGRRPTQGGAFRHRHGLHGAGHDAARHGGGLAATATGLPGFLHLGVCGHRALLHGHGAGARRGA